MKLVIISHTAHFQKSDGSVVGWGPTVREIDYLASLFKEVVHVATLHKSDVTHGFIPYEAKNVRCEFLKPSGGKSIRSKFKVLLSMPTNIVVVWRAICEADWVQLRLPTNLGLYTLPILFIRKRPKRWVKYAGNWMHPSPPLSYRIQRWWLIKNLQRSYVTINGLWPGQRGHLLSFENPCLSNIEYELAKKISYAKKFTGELVLCFVGAVTPAKGILRLLETLLISESISHFERLIIVGDGVALDEAREKSQKIKIPVEFKGFLPHHQIHEVYSRAHVIILPSDSEGFPKVIAEACAYGCVPVVTNVSAIGQYVFNGVNGFLLRDGSVNSITDAINELVEDRSKLKWMSGEAVKLSSQFTYERYIERINKEILNK
ncbi:MAG: glycosyltransferase family 4 protein [Cyclobacteriaceae bacterium]|nr:glycosyltransferase family 4 protein [Cyclobacteriaceae bacterium]